MSDKFRSVRHTSRPTVTRESDLSPIPPLGSQSVPDFGIPSNIINPRRFRSSTVSSTQTAISNSALGPYRDRGINDTPVRPHGHGHTRKISSGVMVRLKSLDALRLNQRVEVSDLGKGKIRFLGCVHFAQGLFVGVELDDPRGTHDGSMRGKRYFNAKDNHGILVKQNRIARILDENNHIINYANPSPPAPQQSQVSGGTATNASDIDKRVVSPMTINARTAIPYGSIRGKSGSVSKPPVSPLVNFRIVKPSAQNPHYHSPLPNAGATAYATPIKSDKMLGGSKGGVTPPFAPPSITVTMDTLGVGGDAPQFTHSGRKMPKSPRTAAILRSGVPARGAAAAAAAKKAAELRAIELTMSQLQKEKAHIKTEATYVRLEIEKYETLNKNDETKLSQLEQEKTVFETRVIQAGQNDFQQKIQQLELQMNELFEELLDKDKILKEQEATIDKLAQKRQYFQDDASHYSHLCLYGCSEKDQVLEALHTSIEERKEELIRWREEIDTAVSETLEDWLFESGGNDGVLRHMEIGRR